MNCPCSSGKLYQNCCKPFHEGTLPERAVDLMRSRFSAYALGLSDYIIHTTYPQSPYFEKDRKKWELAIRKFSDETKFTRLEVVEFGDTWVSFIAHLEQGGQPVKLKEKSSFKRVDGKWLYDSGELSVEK